MKNCYHIIVKTDLDRYGVVSAYAKTLKSAKSKITKFKNKNKYHFNGASIFKEGVKIYES